MANKGSAFKKRGGRKQRNSDTSEQVFETRPEKFLVNRELGEPETTPNKYSRRDETLGATQLYLNEIGFSPLLTAEEEVIDEKTRELRFNIPLLAERLVATTDWLIKQSEYKNFKKIIFWKKIYRS